MRREGLVLTACACARLSVYFAVKLSVNVQAHNIRTYVHVHVFGFCRFCRMLAHAHAVDTRPSLCIIEGLGDSGLGTRLDLAIISAIRQKMQGQSPSINGRD